MPRSLGLLCLIVAAGMPEARAAQNLPVKLDVQLLPRTAPQSQLPIRIALLDAANNPVAAPKRMSVLLQTRNAAGTVEKLHDTEIAAGESSRQLSIEPHQSGLVYIWAKNPELLPGGAYAVLRSGGRAPVKPSPTFAPTRAGLPEIALRFSPDRPFLADGKDTVTVQAFLLGGDDAAPTNVRLNLFDSSGTLQPTPLIIPKGQSTGRASLTSSQAGITTVELLGSTPPTECTGDKKLSIRFMPPITRLSFKASPPSISMADTADLVVELTDEFGRPLNSAAPRDVTFLIDSGRGSIDRQVVKIPPGKFWARTTFQPQWSGPVKVSVSTPNLLTASTDVDVNTPFALLACSLLGGLTGGYVSYMKNRRSGRRRILIGLVTGFVFYWACIFLGLAALGRGIVLNPLSAFSLSTLGGWLQTEVFGTVWSTVRPNKALRQAA